MKLRTGGKATAYVTAIRGRTAGLIVVIEIWHLLKSLKYTTIRL